MRLFLQGMRATLSLRVADLEVYSESRLVVSQVEGSFKAKDSQMIDYLKLMKQMVSKFHKMKLVQITQG